MLAHASLESAPAPATPAAPAGRALAPAVLAQAGTALQARGQGRLRFLGLGIYDATLWTGADFRASRFSEYAFALELTYLREFSDTDIARASIEQMRRHG